MLSHYQISELDDNLNSKLSSGGTSAVLEPEFSQVIAEYKNQFNPHDKKKKKTELLEV
jgi:hypothetical protein